MITSLQILDSYLTAIGITHWYIKEADEGGVHYLYLVVRKGKGIKHLIGKRNLNMQHLKGFLAMYGHAVEGRKNFLILKLENEKV
jgi:hypothetical protein